MIRKLLASAAIGAILLVAAPPAAQAAPARDLSYAKGTGLRKCVSTTYRAQAWHTTKTRPGERCVWVGYWYPRSWVVTDDVALYGGVYWPIMQAPPRGGWHGHQPADASYWPGRAVALQRF